jgi:hypothetical protein
MGRKKHTYGKGHTQQAWNVSHSDGVLRFLRFSFLACWFLLQVHFKNQKYGDNTRNTLASRLHQQIAFRHLQNLFCMRWDTGLDLGLGFGWKATVHWAAYCIAVFFWAAISLGMFVLFSLG